MSVSSGNQKIGNDTLNISLPPVKSCGNCDGCKSQCYALKAYRLYPEVKRNWNENFELWKSNPSEYESLIVNKIAAKNPRHFRWHVSGDIQDQSYLEMMYRIAKVFPGTRFLAFTKMYSLEYAGRPENLEIVFSIWPTMRMPEPNSNISGFAWIDIDYRRTGKALRCSGECIQCMVCFYMAENGIDVMFSIH